ncbi:alpha/beta hydrolase [Amycolatopsis rhizosphaerae]|uniref:Alpha/beta hydrolase n=1 Tax=Amycolatopsis rhizosphaerae TaxID=2053003 RepID=A0A558CVK5_9PSEU|nr:alpha/beta hydrolase [Amycolatopsis rhizosphaerae]TVT52776.1 alpha/beta hydrolase [Amycolatopsis rhizosphaerae]
MRTVTSRDGTAIAYSTSGTGPAVILVDGALCHRAFGPSGPLAEQLKTAFTVYTYDRRGRGESGNTPPYAVEREVEDLEALVEEAGGGVSVYGTSSGAGLALEAAARIPGIARLAVYEPPFIVDDSRPPVPADHAARIEAAVAAGRRGEAVKLFMRQVGAPAVMVAVMSVFPVWSKLKAVAHTLPYDLTIMAGGQRGHALPAEKFASIKAPALAAVGGESPQWMQNSVRAVAAALPDARLRVLPGQNHMVKPRPLAPVLTEFFREKS